MPVDRVVAATVGPDGMFVDEASQAPSGSAFAITPNSSADLAQTTRGIYVGGGGNLVVILADDSASVTFTNVQPGIIYPLRCKRVLATSTATGLVGIV